MIRDGAILLGRRLRGIGAGEYSCIGGHLAFGESLEDCARREAREEAGIELENLRFRLLANVRAYGAHYVQVSFSAEIASGEPVNLEPHKQDEWQWYALDEPPLPLFEMCKLTIESYNLGLSFLDGERVVG